jgi:hypothetical protein
MSHGFAAGLLVSWWVSWAILAGLIVSGHLAAGAVLAFVLVTSSFGAVNLTIDYIEHGISNDR